MIILGKIKRKLNSNFNNFADGTKVIPAIGIQDQVKDILFKIGFTQELDEGETVLPFSELGPICKYNAEGKYIVHKDRPMETAYRQAEWTWEQ